MTRALPRYLVQRVAWATWAAVTGSAACVALVAVLLADRFADQHEKQHLMDAASGLATRLLRPDADVVAVTTDVARERLPTGIRMAVYRGERLVSGDANLPKPLRDGCVVAAPLVSCGLGRGSYFSVAGSDRSALISRQRHFLLLPALIALAMTSLIGALLARRIAGLLVAPLSRLSQALSRVPDDAPERADLGVDEGLAEVDALRRALRETFVRLGHSLSTSRRFAADAAHELRSPLAVMLGQLELSGYELQGEAREANARARRTAERLVTLVDRLLVLATPQSKLAVGEEVELQTAVDEALDRLPLESWPRVTVSAERQLFVKGDRALLASMLANAIENALKFSEGTVQVRLAEFGENHAVVEVADEGPGIPEEYRQRVFEPFFRTPEARSGATRGHGVGLSLIAHVAAVHGGSARFEPRERGTRLVIELPRSR